MLANYRFLQLLNLRRLFFLVPEREAVGFISQFPSFLKVTMLDHMSFNNGLSRLDFSIGQMHTLGLEAAKLLISDGFLLASFYIVTPYKMSSAQYISPSYRCSE